MAATMGLVPLNKHMATSQHDLAQILCLAELCFLRSGVCCIILQAASGWFVIQCLWLELSLPFISSLA